ncbi:MAG: MFS transporter [Solirubrobacteraceae bacterium]|nr:MFS transporter [Solirubrobacteraceae bacterium]
MAAPTPTLDPSELTPSISRVLRRPHVAATLVASVLARLPYGAMTLLTVLRMTDAGYSYGEAGLVAAAYAIAVAVGAPVLSRLVDRRGQTRVLVTTAVTGGAATLLLALLPASSPYAVFLVISAVNGALQPPLGGVMRALWDQMLDREDERHVGYSLDAVAIEMVFTGGPLVLVGVVAAAFGPSAGLLVAAALTTFGTLILASRPPSRTWRPSEHRESHPFGPLQSRGVHTLMLVALGCGGSFGMIELATTAHARAEGSLGLVGVLLAVWSIGSLLGGLAIARVPGTRRPARRLATLLALMAASNAAVGLASSTVALGAILFVAGASIAPTMATANGAMGIAAPDGTLTEAFAWSIGAIMVGLTIGSPAAGFIVDHVSPSAAFAASGIPPALAAASVWLRRRTLAPR